jgi:hypothetical protein
MAGDWIPMRIDLAEDPAVMEMAEALEMPEPHVVGCLHAIWSWASRQCNAGSVTGVTVESLGRVTGCVQVAHAMCEVGWLVQREVDGKQVIEFPKWDRWMSQSAKSRALTAKRVARLRSEKCNGVSVTKSLPEKRREEKSTEENIKKKATPVGETFLSADGFLLPANIDTPDVRKALNDWIAYKRGYKQAGMTALIRKATEIGDPGRIIAAVEHSLTGKYAGLFEPGGNGTSHQTKPVDRVGQILGRTKNANP